MSFIPKHALVTVSIIAVCGIAYLGQGASQHLVTKWGLLFGPFVAAGEWWRVVTNAFMHGGVVHLLVNMGMLFVFGQQLEQAVGGLRFLLIYAGSLAAASLAVVMFAPQFQTLGASGAVIGVVVAYAIVLMIYGRDGRHQSLLMMIGLNLALPLLVPAISFWGHLGGAIGGLLMISVLLVLPQQIRKRQIAAGSVYTAERHPIAKQSLIAGLILVIALLVGSVAAA